MRLRYFGLAICLCLSLLTVHAQQFSTSVSPEFKYDDNPDNLTSFGGSYYYLDLSGKHMQLLYTLKLSKIRFRVKLTKYNSVMQNVKQAKLAEGDRAYGPIDPFLKVLGGKLYLFYYQFATENEENENFHLMAAAIDTTTMNLGTPKEIIAVTKPYAATVEAVHILFENKLLINESPDHSKLVFVWTSSVDYDLLVTVTDSNLDRLWARRETFAFSKYPGLVNAVVDNAGTTAFVSVQLELRKREYEDHLVAIRATGKPLEKQVSLRTGAAYESYLSMLAGDRVRLTGTYYSDNNNSLTGVFSGYVTKDLGLESETVTPFPEELIKKLDDEAESWGWTKNKRYGLHRIDMVPVTLEDGSVSLVGQFEDFKWPTKEYSQIINIHGDALLVHFTDKGATFRSMPLLRYSQSFTFGHGQNVVPYHQQTIVFYNDSKDNLKRDLDKRPDKTTSFQHSILAAYVMDPDGSARRVTVLDLSKDEYVAMIRNMERVSYNTFVVPFMMLRSTGKYDDHIRWVTVTVN